MLIRKSAGNYLIECTVIPRSREEKVVGIVADTLKVKLTAAPTDSKANKQLIGLLADEFGLRQKNIEIVKGSTSRHKTLAIDGDAELPRFLIERLGQSQDQSGQAENGITQ